jgi:hypothetical protein
MVNSSGEWIRLKFYTKQIRIRLLKNTWDLLGPTYSLTDRISFTQKLNLENICSLYVFGLSSENLD